MENFQISLKEYFRKNNLSLNNFDNKLFGAVSSFSFFQRTKFTKFQFQIEFQSQNYYHPSKFSLNVLRDQNKINFFDHIAKSQFFLNQFSNSHCRFRKISFFRLKKSYFKFRKRKNVYFNFNTTSVPQDKFLFLKNLPSFLRTYVSLTKRFKWFYTLNAPLFKIQYIDNALIFFFLNPNYVTFFLENKNLVNIENIIRLKISSSKNDNFLIALLKNFNTNLLFIK